MTTPAGADVEIERKYLLRSLPGRAEGIPGLWIEQGWLPGEVLQERIRRTCVTENPVGGLHPSWARFGKYYRTVKLGRGLKRIEIEEECSSDLGDALWKLTDCQISKFRVRIPVDDLVWEVDLFSRLNLILAEVELPTEDTEVVLPEWLVPHVVREVTGESRYVNLNLARHGLG